MEVSIIVCIISIICALILTIWVYIELGIIMVTYIVDDASYKKYIIMTLFWPIIVIYVLFKKLMYTIWH